VHVQELLEKRKSKRFPVHAALHYQLRNRNRENLAGVGETLDMSSSGILFSAQESIHVGRILEVCVNWPARLNGTCALTLVAVGPVVRSEGNLVAMMITRHEFHTRGTPPRVAGVPQ
jgi:hypothetical protein